MSARFVYAYAHLSSLLVDAAAGRVCEFSRVQRLDTVETEEPERCASCVDGRALRVASVLIEGAPARAIRALYSHRRRLSRRDDGRDATDRNRRSSLLSRDARHALLNLICRDEPCRTMTQERRRRR